MAILWGTFRADRLVGTDTADTLFGFAGDDVLTGKLGDDSIYGGLGLDTAVIRGSVLETTVTRQGYAGITWAVAAGPDGTDQLILVERIQFDDYLFNLVGNNVPFLLADTASTREDRAVEIPITTLLANDREFDGDPLRFQGVDTTGTRGTVTVVDGSVRYDPAGQFDALRTGETATDTFRYSVSDGKGGVASTTVTVTIEGVGGQAVDVLDGVGFVDGDVVTYLNDGSGAFAFSFTDPYPVDDVWATLHIELDLGDMDGDGDLDAVDATMGITAGAYNLLFVNDGRGFLQGELLPGETVGERGSPPNSRDVALGDIDGDGDLDIVFANTPRQYFVTPKDQILVNDGTGTFSVVQLGSGSSSEAVELGDLDGDEDLDMIRVDVDPQSAPQLLINDGAGGFTSSPVAGATGGKIAMADVDVDGDLDAFVGTQLWVNNGAAQFAISDSGLGGTPVLADLDADGDFDGLVVERPEGQDAPEVGIWFNDGAGRFTRAGELPISFSGYDRPGLAVADLDADGDIDVVVGNEYSTDWVAYNDGSGAFDVVAQPETIDFVRPVVGDLDGTPALTPAGLPDLGPLVPVPGDPALY